MLNLAVGMNKMIEICLRNFARVPERHTLKPQRILRSNTRISYTRRPRKKWVHGQPHAAADFTLGDKAVSALVTRHLPGHEVVFRQYICVAVNYIPVFHSMATHVRDLANEVPSNTYCFPNGMALHPTPPPPQSQSVTVPSLVFYRRAVCVSFVCTK